MFAEIHCWSNCLAFAHNYPEVCWDWKTKISVNLGSLVVWNWVGKKLNVTFGVGIPTFIDALFAPE